MGRFMLRGINQQHIFEVDEDYEKFLEILKDCKEKIGIIGNTTVRAICFKTDLK